MQAYIFDVDGTLIDSYEGIIDSVVNILNRYKYYLSREEIEKYILTYSVQDLFIKIAKEKNLDYRILYKEYKHDRINTQANYKFMPDAINVLNTLYEMNAKLFIFTHKGKYIHTLLKDNNLENLFIEVISCESDTFTRKPNPDSLIYLMEKYNLKNNNTFYVGDRPIDVMCANNAHIKSIFYDKKNMDLENSNPTFRIKTLNELLEIERGLQK